MFYIIPAWVISLVATFILGYYLRGLVKKVEQLEKTLRAKVDKPVKTEEPDSMIIDPTDPLIQAMFEQRELMRKLNPHE